jgi:S-adenosyl methyltransferase
VVTRLTGSGAGAAGGIDTSAPNVARIYDYILGGKDNFAADRHAAQQLLAALPDR